MFVCVYVYKPINKRDTSAPDSTIYPGFRVTV